MCGTESPGVSGKGEVSMETVRDLDRDLAHLNRGDEMADLVASLAHEITEPIAAVKLGAEACLRWINRDSPALDEVQQVLLRIIKDTQRAASIVERNRSLYCGESDPTNAPGHRSGAHRLVQSKRSPSYYTSPPETDIASG